MRRTRRVPGNGLAVPAIVAILALPAVADAAPSDICIPQLNSIFGLPIIDGDLYGDGSAANQPDVGWNNAGRYVLQGFLGGGAPPNAWLQLGRTGTDVYLSLEVSQVLSDAETTVALAFSVDSNSDHDWRIHINPFPDSTNNPTGFNQQPHAVNAWRNSATWNGLTPTTVSKGATAWFREAGPNIRWSRPGNGSKWYLEMKIPISATENDGIAFPASGVFKLWVDVISTHAVTATTTEDAWPNGSIIPTNPDPMVIVDIVKSTPAPSLWANYKLGPPSMGDIACTGVSIAWSDVGVATTSGGMLGSRIDVPAVSPLPADCNTLGTTASGNDNFFTANFSNNSGTTANVFAIFRQAAWGLPGQQDFECVQGPGITGAAPCPTFTGSVSGNNNPTLEGTTRREVNWNLSQKQACEIRKAATPGQNLHRCMQVDLDSSDPNTRFLNKSVQKNMDFGTASTFQADATISGNQGPLESGTTSHKFLLFVETEQRYPLTDQQKKDIQNQIDKYRNQDLRTTHGSVAGGDSQFPEMFVPAGARFTDLTLEHFANGSFGQQSPALRMLAWMVRGYVHTGRKLRINGHDYEYVRPVGDFGYVAGHNGTLAGFLYDLAGPKLKRLAPNAFELDLTPGDQATVSTTIQSLDKCPAPCFCFSRGVGTSLTTCALGLVLLGSNLRRRKRKDANA